jgi:hypothetical protein
LHGNWRGKSLNRNAVLNAKPGRIEIFPGIFPSNREIRGPARFSPGP